MAGKFEWWPRAVLNGVAQAVFCDNPIAGLLQIGALFFLSPWIALGGLVGALVGTVVGDRAGTWSKLEVGLGLAGVNLSILGSFLGYIAQGARPEPVLFAVAVLVCLTIEHGLRRGLERFTLPTLSLPAVATLFLIAGLYASIGRPFWPSAQIMPLGDVGPYAAIALSLVAMATKSIQATILTAALAGTAAILSGLATGNGLIGPVGLWAFTVAPCVFGIHAVFLAGSRLGAIAGTIAALIGAALWTAWMVSPLAAIMPPLLIPFILATWLVIAVGRRVLGPEVFLPSVWSVVGAIRQARAAHRPVIVMTGAGASTASGIPDYVSGTWLDADIPASTYAYDRFLTSAQCRRYYWDACDRFRAVAAAARPNAGHRALAGLEADGWITTVITQNVDRLHQAAGSDAVIELHGRVDRARCLSCGETGDWPPARVWQRFDLTCKTCGGLLKPAVIAMGETIPPIAWDRAVEAVTDCGVLVIVGSQMAVSSAAALMAKAREYGARIVFVNVGGPPTGYGPGDVLVGARAEAALPAIARLLGSESVAGSRPVRTTASRTKPASGVDEAESRATA